MKHKRFGFTLIEVALFLAITGLLFIGIAAGTQNSIWQQRFYDSVQNYAEFLRSIYSQVSNPQSVGDGRSEYAIYGKLVVFGESVGLDGEDVNEGDTQQVFVYDVVGDVSGTGTGTAKELLKSLGANVIVATEWWEDGKVKQVSPAGIVTSYSPRWAASIEVTDSNALFTGSILVVRHPRSGTINTLVSSEIIEVNETIREANLAYAARNTYDISGLLIDDLDSFESREVDFCVNPYGIGTPSELRRDIRLVSNARNASGVEIIDLDSSENQCRDL